MATPDNTSEDLGVDEVHQWENDLLESSQTLDELQRVGDGQVEWSCGGGWVQTGLLTEGLVDLGERSCLKCPLGYRFWVAWVVAIESSQLADEEVEPTTGQSHLCVSLLDGIFRHIHVLETLMTLAVTLVTIIVAILVSVQLRRSLQLLERLFCFIQHLVHATLGLIAECTWDLNGSLQRQLKETFDSRIATSLAHIPRAFHPPVIGVGFVGVVLACCAVLL